MTFKNHAKNQAEKASKRLNIRKRLAGSTWGASTHTLRTTYKVYVLPVLTFGEEMMICASKAVNKQLEMFKTSFADYHWRSKDETKNCDGASN